MMIKSYRELNVWQKADKLALDVYQLSDGFPKKYPYDLTNPLRRSALSVPTNLAEGSASPYSGELLQLEKICSEIGIMPAALTRSIKVQKS